MACSHYHKCFIWVLSNIFRPILNGRYFTDDIFKWIFYEYLYVCFKDTTVSPIALFLTIKILYSVVCCIHLDLNLQCTTKQKLHGNSTDLDFFGVFLCSKKMLFTLTWGKPYIYHWLNILIHQVPFMVYVWHFVSILFDTSTFNCYLSSVTLHKLSIDGILRNVNDWLLPRYTVY